MGILDGCFVPASREREKQPPESSLGCADSMGQWAVSCVGVQQHPWPSLALLSQFSKTWWFSPWSDMDHFLNFLQNLIFLAHSYKMGQKVASSAVSVVRQFLVTGFTPFHLPCFLQPEMYHRSVPFIPLSGPDCDSWEQHACSSPKPQSCFA